VIAQLTTLNSFRSLHHMVSSPPYLSGVLVGKLSRPVGKRHRQGNGVLAELLRILEPQASKNPIRGFFHLV